MFARFISYYSQSSVAVCSTALMCDTLKRSYLRPRVMPTKYKASDSIPLPGLSRDLGMAIKSIARSLFSSFGQFPSYFSQSRGWIAPMYGVRQTVIMSPLWYYKI